MTMAEITADFMFTPKECGELSKVIEIMESKVSRAKCEEERIYAAYMKIDEEYQKLQAQHKQHHARTQQAKAERAALECWLHLLQRMRETTRQHFADFFVEARELQHSVAHYAFGTHE